MTGKLQLRATTMPSFRDLLVAGFILGMLPAVLTHPHWGILLWTWVGLMNPHKMTWGFAYNFPFAMLIGAVTIVAILISREPKRLPLQPPIVVLALLIVWFGITTVVFSLYPNEAWPKLEKVLKIQLFIFLTLLVMQSEERIKALVLVATLSIAFFGIKGGVYTIMKGGGGMVLGPDGGFIAGNTEIALALVVTLPLMRWLQLQARNIWLKRAAGVSMVLIAISVLGSYSRGGLLALAAVALFLLLKGRRKFVFGIALVVAVPLVLSLMPQEWYAKMDTIEGYEQNSSAMKRLGAWKFAWNLASDRPVGGGGFETFQESAYARWAPGESPFDPHSIWFQLLGEHGFVGLGLFIIFWFCAWRTGSGVIRLCGRRPDLFWARDLAAMIQCAMVGFWVGGSFLGLAYWDYPYILVIILVLTKVVVERQIASESVKPAARGIGLQPSPVSTQYPG